jgi:hypothetical protein
MNILLLTHPMPAAPFASAIRGLAPDHELIEYRPDIDAATLAEIDVVLGWQMPRGVAAKMPKLRWVCAVAAGVDKLLVEDLADDVPVSRIVDAEQAEGIAQFVVMMALRHARSLPLYEAQQRERQWKRNPIAAVRSNVAVLGTGAMGSVVVRLLGTVGFEARGWSRASAEPLESVLGASDIVVCALPLTAQTEGMLDAKAFRGDAARQLPDQHRARRPRRRGRSDRGGALGPARRCGARRPAARADAGGRSAVVGAGHHDHAAHRGAAVDDDDRDPVRRGPAVHCRRVAAAAGDRPDAGLLSDTFASSASADRVGFPPSAYDSSICSGVRPIDASNSDARSEDIPGGCANTSADRALIARKTPWPTELRGGRSRSEFRVPGLLGRDSLTHRLDVGFSTTSCRR